MLKQQMFNVTTIKHFLLVAWPCLQRFSFKKHITALRILNFITRAKDLYLLL